MDINKMFFDENEKPLDRLVSDGGYAAVFRSFGCIGDSLSSGEFEKYREGGHGFYDFYEYSWGQFMARMCGSKAYNFSKGGMTAERFLDGFGVECGCWNPENICQAYILALGVNDILVPGMDIGTVADVDLDDYNNNADSFAGRFVKIMQKCREVQPDAKLFLVTMPKGGYFREGQDEQADKHEQLMYDIAETFGNTYVIDLRKYGPTYEGEFGNGIYMCGHLNAAGYLLTAQMIASYIDYIVRHNLRDFRAVGFIGTRHRNIKVPEKE